MSLNGTLVYAPSAREVVIPRTLVWVDRQGHETPLGAPPRPYAAARISPDGTRIALDIRDQQNDIWTWDTRREAMTRVTFDPTVDMCPVWTLDGKRIVWASLRATGTPVLFSQSADGTGISERMGSTANPVFPTSVAPDGRIITWENSGPGSVAGHRRCSIRSRKRARRSSPRLRRSSTAKFRPMVVGSHINQMNRAGTKSTCVRFPT